MLIALVRKGKNKWETYSILVHGGRRINIDDVVKVKVVVTPKAAVLDSE